MSWTKEGMLIFISTLLSISLLRGLAFKDLCGAGRCILGAGTGSLTLLHLSPWTLLVHSAVCTIGWLFEVGPWMLDFNGSKAAASSHTLLIVALLAPLCWMLGLWINMKLYIQMCIKDELLPLRSRMQSVSETPFSTLFSWEVVDASK
mmetsp:Transcript_35259/g.56727  ORF Transcript_35259/g.56727 Transcript_35259/m.56727 type:complete len:148 (-) Transcript_35259:166-609(-)